MIPEATTGASVATVQNQPKIRPKNAIRAAANQAPGESMRRAPPRGQRQQKSTTSAEDQTAENFDPVDAARTEQSHCLLRPMCAHQHKWAIQRSLTFTDVT
jgi:hypothetical protein